MRSRVTHLSLAHRWPVAERSLLQWGSPWEVTQLRQRFRGICEGHTRAGHLPWPLPLACILHAPSVTSLYRGPLQELTRGLVASLLPPRCFQPEAQQHVNDSGAGKRSLRNLS